MMVSLDFLFATWTRFKQKGDSRSRPLLSNFLCNSFYVEDMSAAQLDARLVSNPRNKANRAEGLIFFAQSLIWIFSNTVWMQSREAFLLSSEAFARVTARMNFVAALLNGVLAFLAVANIFEGAVFIYSQEWPFRRTFT